MGRNVERIDQTLEKKLYDIAEEMAKKNGEKKEQLDYFTSKWTTITRFEQRPKRKDMTYEMLSDLLEICEMSIPEAFKLLDVEVHYPTSDYDELAKICNSLNKDTLNKLNKLQQEAISPWWNETDDTRYVPTRRIFQLLERKVERSERRTDMPESLMRGWKDQHRNTKILTSGIPEASYFLDTSLRWILGASPNVLMFTNSPEAEQVVDDYAKMSYDMREHFLEIARLLAKGE